MTIACAPMAAITHAAFRTLVESLCTSCDEYYSEMIGAGAFVSGGQYEKWYVIEESAPNKIVWQVVGGDESRLAEAAARLAEKHGIGIDINIGCSAPNILRAGAGAAWLDKDAIDLRRMVKAVRSAVKSVDKNKRVSVKMRIAGRNTKDSWLEDTIKMLCDEGVERIALHARSAGEKYRGAVRWSEVEKALKAAKSGVSIALNGDITDGKSLIAALAACPSADCIMVGRQAAKTPWVFDVLKAQMQNTPLERTIDREKVALDFIALLKQYQPQDFWRTRCKRFFAYYAQGFSFAHYFATQMANCHSIDEAISRVRDYFNRQPSDRVLTI